MASRSSSLSAESPRARLIAVALGLVVLLQIAAFYTLCADQVRKANARDAGVMQQHATLTQCLQDSAQSTIGSCHGQQRARYNDGSSVPAQAHLRDAAYTLPVNFSFR